MTERHDLERELRALSAAIECPPGDGLSENVGRVLRAGVRRSVPRRVTWPRRRILVVTVAVLLLLTASAGAARLVIGAIEIKVVPTEHPSALPETGPNLGTSMSIAEAKGASGFSISVPHSLGRPDAVFFDHGRVSLCWRSGPTLPRIPRTPWGAVLVELRAQAVTSVKEVPQGTSIQPVHVGAAHGYFITGPTDLLARGGRLFQVPGGVVLWQAGSVTLRLESLLPKAAALRLATSVS